MKPTTTVEESSQEVQPMDNFPGRYHVPSPKSRLKKARVDTLPRKIYAHFLHANTATKTLESRGISSF